MTLYAAVAQSTNRLTMRGISVLILSIIASLFSLTPLFAQRHTSFGYYDVDKLYDTEPSTFYDDRAYTPKGRYNWDKERYRRKVENIASIIDTMHLAAIALYGAENEAVVRDIVTTSKLEYGYLHRTLSTDDGLDFALLYAGDRLFIEEVESGFDYLSIKCEFDHQPTLILLVRNSDAANTILREVSRYESNRRIIVAGRTSRVNSYDFCLRDACQKAERRGRGNSVYKAKWQMSDRILTDSAQTSDAEVFIRDYLIDFSGAPRGTFSYRRYVGGYSSKLPIYIFID